MKTHTSPIATPSDQTRGPASGAVPTASTVKRQRLIVACKFLTALFFFSYVVFRGVTIEATNDEPLLGRDYVSLIVFDWVDAQVHFLSDLLIKLCVDILPITPPASTRVPSMLSFLLFLWAASSITRHLRSNAWLELLAFAAFASNSFILDFFGLARGYAPALAMMLLSIKFLLEYVHREAGETREQRLAHFAIWAAFISVLLNMAYLHVYLGIAFILLCLSPRTPNLLKCSGKDGCRSIGQWLASNSYLMYNGAILGVFYLPRMLNLIKMEKLYFGGDTGFVQDSVRSLAECSFYDIQVSEVIQLVIAYAITFLSLAFSAISFRLPGRRFSVRACRLFSAILLLSAFSLWACHWLFGAKFVIERAALMLIPLFIGQLVFFAASLRSGKLRLLLALIPAAFVCLFTMNANLTHTLTWRMNSGLRDLVAYLSKEQDTLNRPLILAVSDGLKYKLDGYKKELGVAESDIIHYSIDIHHRFHGRYYVDPRTDFFYLWEPEHAIPKGLEGLPLTEAPFRRPHTWCSLYRVTPGKSLAPHIEQMQIGQDGQTAPVVRLHGPVVDNGVNPVESKISP